MAETTLQPDSFSRGFYGNIHKAYPESKTRLTRAYKDALARAGTDEPGYPESESDDSIDQQALDKRLALSERIAEYSGIEMGPAWAAADLEPEEAIEALTEMYGPGVNADAVRAAYGVDPSSSIS